MANTAPGGGRPAGDVEPSCSILVLHPAELDPRPFLHRLIGTSPRPTQSAQSERSTRSQSAASTDGTENAATLKRDEKPQIAAGSSTGHGDSSERGSDGHAAFRAEGGAIEWGIDNKYYTATSSEDQNQGLEGDGEVPVVMYLFTDQPPDPLPALLTRLITSAPRDIALAVRVKPVCTKQTSESEGQTDMLGEAGARWDIGLAEEAFEELGMEVIDEWVRDGVDGESDGDDDDDDDDERPMDPLDQIRQTLQTHIWPNMIRKPLGTARGRGHASYLSAGAADEEEDVISLVGSASASDSSQYSDDDDDDDGGDDAMGIGGVSFPVSFDSHMPDMHLSNKLSGNDFNDHNDDNDIDLDLDPEELDALDDAFPSIAALRAQLSAAAAPNVVSPTQHGASAFSPAAAAAPGPSSAYAGLLAMNTQLALANREFAQLKQEREMASERRLRRLEALERDLMGESDSEGDEEPDGTGLEGAEVGDGGVAGGGVISFGGQREEAMLASAVTGNGYSHGQDRRDQRVGSGPSEQEWRRLEAWLSLDREQVEQMSGEAFPEELGASNIGGLGAITGRGAASRQNDDDPIRTARSSTYIISSSVGQNGEVPSVSAMMHETGSGGDESDDDAEVDECGSGAGYARLDDPEDVVDDGTELDDDFGEFARAPATDVPASVQVDNMIQPGRTPDVDGDEGLDSASGDARGDEDELAFEDDFTASADLTAFSAPAKRLRTLGASIVDSSSSSSPSRNSTAKSNPNPNPKPGSSAKPPKRSTPKTHNPQSNFPPLPLDPTPLLLHLQSIRAELAGLEDEDERRVRAAREVGGLMRSLGVEGWDEGDLRDLDGGGVEVGGGMGVDTR